MRARILVMFCMLVVLIRSPLVSHAQEHLPRFEPSNCPVDVPDSPRIACGYLVVPEDYDAPESSIIRLPVIIIHSHSLDPAPDPILYTEGGPGYSSLSSVWWFAQSDFVDDRDVVILEQRGNLHAQPNLVCDVDTAWGEENGAPCLERFKEQGIDLSQYTTANIVADINALRQTLPYEMWNLYGSSYSTRLMQLTMQQHPENIRSVILQSVSSLSETRYEHDPEHAMRALQMMLDDCAADQACAAAYPDLETALFTAVHHLNAEPVSFDFIDSETGAPYSVAVDGRCFIDWMVTDAFYGPARPPHKTAYMPLLIDQVAQGHTEFLFPWLVDQMHNIFMSDAFAWGLYFAVNCQDDASVATMDMMAAQTAVYPQLDGYIRAARELEICAAWDLPAAPPLLTEPLTSDIPTLILAGSYDPITPPIWGEAVATNLSNSYFYEFSSAGHNVSNDNPCAERIKLAFLQDPTTAPASSCIAEVPAPEFVLPDDVSLAPGFYSSVYDLDIGNPERGNPLLEIISSASLILFLLVIGYLLVAAIVRLFRRNRAGQSTNWTTRLTSILAGLTAVLAWAFVILISEVNSHLSHTEWLLFHFGTPPNDPLVFAIAILVPLFIILTLAFVIVILLGWMRQDNPIWKRLFFTLTAVAAVVFAGFMVHWDFHALLF